jgi:RNA polymerase sigma factor (sigma-70 family)
VIHDRYRQRLFAYTRQMLPHRQDAEDALQDIFVRAYAGLRANRRDLALRAWLYRVAHNRCIDELRRPSPPPPEVMQLLRSPVHDPIAQADQRESLRRLIADVRRLPDQQRSALLMRELGGMSYADMAAALGITIPAVKSLLVRARLALGQALAARDTACSEIREELILAHDRGLRPNATARRHMRDCAGCREFRHQLRGVSRRFAAIVPTLGPLGVAANMLGAGGAGGGALAAGGAVGSSTAVVSVGTMTAGAGHMAALLAAAVVTAGGAVELQHTLPAPSHHHHARVVAPAATPPPARPSAPAALGSPSDLGAPKSAAVIIAPAPPSVANAPTSPRTPSTTPAASRPTSSTATTPTKIKLHPSGGISIPIAGGGVSASAPANSSSTLTGTTSSTPTGPSTSTGTTSQPIGPPPTDATSTTPDTSTTPTTPSAPSSTTTGSSQGNTTGTDPSTGTATGTPSAPSQ